MREVGERRGRWAESDEGGGGEKREAGRNNLV